MDENTIRLGGYIVNLMTNLNNAAVLTSTKQVHDMLLDSQKQSEEMFFPKYKFVEAMSRRDR